jgi:SAM-dependent methyltransferase
MARTRISEPHKRTYAHKRTFYRDSAVAAYYDDERFVGPFKRRRNRLKWQRICDALATLDDIRSVLDLPCGTGRFTGSLATRGLRVVGSDISLEMMRRALEAVDGSDDVGGFVQADAEWLPFSDDSIDCVVSIRFMFHVPPPTRVSILREMGRVAPWVVVDYRHRYSYRYAKWRALRALRLTRRSLERVSRAGMEQEFRDAGLSVRRVLPVTRVFSDKWIVVAGRGDVA